MLNAMKEEKLSSMTEIGKGGNSESTRQFGKGLSCRCRHSALKGRSRLYTSEVMNIKCGGTQSA